MIRARFVAALCLALAPSAAFAQTPQEAVEYYALDALGSVRVVLDVNGTITGRMDYGPFGEELSSRTGLPSRAYARLFRDGEAGLDHAEARSYQSRTGRFSSVDPLYGGLIEPQGWNRYAYAYNAPTKYIDPRGLSAWNGLCDYRSGYEDGVFRTFTECISGDIAAFIGGYGWTGTSSWDPFFGGGGGGRGSGGRSGRGGGADSGGSTGSDTGDTPASPPADPPNPPPSDPPIPPRPNPPPTTRRVDWDYWKGFLQGFKDEFGEDGCARVFFNATVDALSPFSLSASSFGDASAAYLTAWRYNQVIAYAASRPNYLGGTGLIYPNKSAVVQEMMRGVRSTAASGALFSLDLAIVQGFAIEMYDMHKGQCR